MAKVCSLRMFVGLVIVLLIAAWGFIFYLALTHGTLASSILQRNRIFSYEATLTEYRSAIRGLIYNTPPVITVKEPVYFKLGDLLTAWNPDDTSQERWSKSVAHPSKGNHLARFDYTDESQRAMALKYRNDEIPFIVTNVPEIQTAITTNFASDSLRKNLADEVVFVEKISSNNYMFYHEPNQARIKKLYPEWQRPQVDVTMKFDEFLNEVNKAEAAPDYINSSIPLYYYTISAGQVR
jgi:hypothetical protein